MTNMPPNVEKLVRLMVLLPHDLHDPLWDSVTEDCGDASTVLPMHWWVGDTAKMWPEGAPRTLAEMILIAFGDPSDKTLRLISKALAGERATGPGVGAAWAARVRETAVDVMAEHDHLDEVLQAAKEHWTLNN